MPKRCETETKVSALMRGQLKNFSLDRLCRFLNHLDKKVSLTPNWKTLCKRKSPVASMSLPVKSCAKPCGSSINHTTWVQ